MTPFAGYELRAFPATDQAIRATANLEGQS
jgi:hypothetical protein